MGGDGEGKGGGGGVGMVFGKMSSVMFDFVGKGTRDLQDQVQGQSATERWRAGILVSQCLSSFAM